MNMIISGISDHNGEKRAFVRFEEGSNFAEGTIPDCKIEKSDGFTGEELSLLEEYMQQNLAMLKRKAAENNPIRAMMRED